MYNRDTMCDASSSDPKKVREPRDYNRLYKLLCIFLADKGRRQNRENLSKADDTCAWTPNKENAEFLD